MSQRTSQEPETMASYSPYASTPAPEFYFEGKFPSPSPTPSPRGPGYYGAPPIARPATRAHFRTPSTTGAAFPRGDFPSPRTPSFSPRYTSDGQYATANVSQSRSSRKQSFSASPPRRERRSTSFSYYPVVETHHGESDEDELIEIDGVTYLLPGRKSKSRRSKDFFTVNAGRGHATDYHYYKQGGPYFDREREAGFASPRFDREQERRTAPIGHARRSSASIPQRPQTARPVATAHKKPPPPPATRPATEADAKRHKIPPGYSLKNWDPTEEPIMLLGSVFDANSLGKWIYDWTVYHHGPSTPISDMAGELWLLLIQLAGKIKRAEESVPKIRALENKQMVEDFIEAGDRLTDKLRKLLKACEAPMLRVKTTQKKDPQLGKNAGVEFVETLFGRERELEKTERFMHSVRLWNLRFDTNCEEILRSPTL